MGERGRGRRGEGPPPVWSPEGWAGRLGAGGVHQKSLDGHYFRAVKTRAGISKDIGFEANLILTYKVTGQVSLVAGASRFFTGIFFKDATGSGRDINFGYMQLQAVF